LNALGQALRISPEDPVAHDYLGLTYENLGRPQEAIAAYRQAIGYKTDYAESGLTIPTIPHHRLSPPGNFQGMVCAFLTSDEYQEGFGSTVTRSNADCDP